jgi:hypothetical protein
MDAQIDKKITIVGGMTRSGTSLNMLILKELGMTIVGNKFRKNREKDIMNPTGFWELPGVIIGRIENPLSFYDKVIKVVGIGISAIDPVHIEQTIFCIRRPGDLILSRLKSFIHKTHESDKEMAVRFKGYIAEIGQLFLAWPSIENTLIVDHDELLIDPKTEVTRIAEFVNRPVTQNAIDCVEQSLWRSKSDYMHEIADSVYENIRDRRFDEAKEQITKYLDENHIPHARKLPHQKHRED